MKNSLVLIALLSSFTARAQVCRSVFETSVPANGFVANIAPITRAELHRKSIEPTMRKETRPLLPDKRAKGLIEEAKKPHRAGEYGPRLITDEIGETPDIDKPVWVTLPDGTRKAFFGLSGQQYLLVDSIDQLARGGTQRPSKIQLFNEHGFPYGEDYDKTGKRIPYALDSSTWDVSLVQAFDENGHPQLKVLAGAMANGGNGRPLRITQKNAAQTRRRVVFHDVQFVQTASGEWSLSARRPKSPFFNTVLRDGSWSRFEKDGTPIMIHSYGGGAVKLADGSSYVDSSGNIHWAGDGVIEVRKIIGAKTGEWTYAPYHSGMYMAKLDPYDDKGDRSSARCFECSERQRHVLQRG